MVEELPELLLELSEAELLVEVDLDEVVPLVIGVLVVTATEGAWVELLEEVLSMATFQVPSATK